MADSRRDEIVARAHRVLKYDFLPTNAPERILAQDILTMHEWLLDEETEKFDQAMECFCSSNFIPDPDCPEHGKKTLPAGQGRSE